MNKKDNIRVKVVKTIKPVKKELEDDINKKE